MKVKFEDIRIGDTLMRRGKRVPVTIIHFNKNGTPKLDYKDREFFREEYDRATFGEHNPNYLHDYLVMTGQAKPKCVITNGRYSWTLEVDNHSIDFHGQHNGLYFIDHYKKLGYEVELLP